MNAIITSAIKQSRMHNGETVRIHDDSVTVAEVRATWESLCDGDDSADSDHDGNRVWGWDSSDRAGVAQWAVEIVAA